MCRRMSSDLDEARIDRSYSVRQSPHRNNVILVQGYRFCLHLFSQVCVVSLAGMVKEFGKEREQVVLDAKTYGQIKIHKRQHDLRKAECYTVICAHDSVLFMLLCLSSLHEI